MHFKAHRHTAVVISYLLEYNVTLTVSLLDVQVGLGQGQVGAQFTFGHLGRLDVTVTPSARKVSNWCLR